MNATRNLLALVFVVAATLPGGRVAADFIFGPPENLGPAINDADFDYWPRISQDGLCLSFQQQDVNSVVSLCMATRATKADPWKAAVNLGALTGLDVLPALLKPFGDGLEIYFTWRGNGADYDLWMMKRETTEAGWGPPVNLGPVVNSPADEACPALSPNALELYFSGIGYADAYVRPGGYGSADLWVTRRATRNDPWGAPVNLGPVVNSAKNDRRPYLSADGLVLFFDSARAGSSGLDLYLTRRTTVSDPWGPPINLGPVINSPAHEEYACVSADGTTLYWDCARPGGYGSNDIWQASITPIVDFNGDKKVDLVDLVMLIENWGTSKTLYDIGPMPWGDDKVDIDDLKVFMTHWEKERPADAKDGSGLDRAADFVGTWASDDLNTSGQTRK
ncbi:MAG: hypothetical protein FJ280_20905 [Planctomycetes bacterium]|nr:hypothetical protein [Planctomycetota bacterium]